MILAVDLTTKMVEIIIKPRLLQKQDTIHDILDGMGSCPVDAALYTGF